MQDGRFERAVSDLLSTFFTRTFQNMMPLILEVLEKMKSDYTKERDTICMSYGRLLYDSGPVDLYKFVNEAYDLSMVCLDPVVQKGILNLINK